VYFFSVSIRVTDPDYFKPDPGEMINCQFGSLGSGSAPDKVTDQTKRCGSDRIWIRNTGFYVLYMAAIGGHGTSN
jgi:hypothetical protein